MNPVIRKDLTVHLFDSSSISQKYLLVTSDRRQFEISQGIYDLINLMDGTRNLEDITRQYSNISRQQFDASMVQYIIDNFLCKNNLLLDQTQKTTKKDSILYFKVPLLTEKNVCFVTKYLQYLFSKKVIVSNCLILTGFLFYFLLFFNGPKISILSLTITDVLIIYFFLFFSTLFHEFGHASACRFFDVKSSKIGVGLYVYFPVLFTDVSEVWRLKRWQRVIVDIGGIYFQLIIIPFLFLSFFISENPIFIKLIYSILISFLGTLNPFFHFDGYWLVSDITGIPNLRERASKIILLSLRNIFRKNKVEYPQVKAESIDSKNVLVLYAVISNLFFITYILLFVIYSPKLFMNYSLVLNKFILLLFNSPVIPSLEQVWNFISVLFFPTLVIIAGIFMMYRMLRKLLSLSSRMF